MNRRSRQNRKQPYQPYKNVWHAALDIRQESALTVQHDQVIQSQARLIHTMRQHITQLKEFVDTNDEQVMGVIEQIVDDISAIAIRYARRGKLRQQEALWLETLRA